MNQRIGEPELSAWCRQHLGAAPAETIFDSGHLSVVAGYRLTDDRLVVLKGRLAEERLRECFAVQRYLWEKGFPCPRPIAGPSMIGTYLITAEELVAGDEALEGGPGAAVRFATPLARLVQICSSYRIRGTLDPAPPWVGWSHEGTGLWPSPDDLDLNLNDYPEPAWLNYIAERVAIVLRCSKLPRTIGHVDWHPGNLRWMRNQLKVVHDWDSLAYLPEAAIAGGASVLYTQDSRASASVDESQAFLDAYAAARGHPWTQEELQVCWAAGTWNLAFDAKKQTLDGLGDSFAVLEQDAEFRLRRAGI